RNQAPAHTGTNAGTVAQPRQGAGGQKKRDALAQARGSGLTALDVGPGCLICHRERVRTGKWRGATSPATSTRRGTSRNTAGNICAIASPSSASDTRL